jgi:protein involved in polysaccharide export with SLBB domain
MSVVCFLCRGMKIMLALLILTIGVLNAQFQDKQEAKRQDPLYPDFPEKSVLQSVQSPEVALESSVNPENYFVGPSDVIVVNIWMSPPLSFPLTVTPEGTLIVPTVGEVAVSDMTLARAKTKILFEIRKKYLTAGITATLLKPRPIVISVVGAVMNAGLYTLSAVDRANRAVAEANKLVRLQTSNELEVVLRFMSTRNIVVKHKDGSAQHVDLPRYFATRDEQWNPYLREGDVVVVPRKDPLRDVFAIYGEVNTAGRFEYVEGDSLMEALRIANGLTRMALTENVLFSRMNPDGTELSNRTINLVDIEQGKDPDFPLQPGDRIVVNKRIDARGDFNVDVKGEVVYPGTYPITRNQTHLSEVIRRSGGFTGFAWLGSATVFRHSLQPEDLENERLANLRGSMGTLDSTGFAFETELRLKREAVTADFVRLFEQKDSSQDIILQPEDQIVVPARTPTVYVFGQVVSPGHIAFVKGKESKYYIEKAGGFTGRANKGNLAVIKATTKQWLSPGDTNVEEGDYIWVPTEPDRPFSYYMTIASQAASVLSIVIGVGVIIVQVTK